MRYSEVKNLQAEIFSGMPNELKTIEVDIDKKIFNINGVPFGKECTGFYISCDSTEGFKVRVDINTRVHYASYYGADGNKKSDHIVEKCGQKNQSPN